jgi:hypothetical protein
MRKPTKRPKRLLKRPGQKRNPAPIGMIFWPSQGDPGMTLLIVPRVGTIEHVPHGYQLGLCDNCSHVVWCNSQFVDHYESKGFKLRVECMTCVPLS